MVPLRILKDGRVQEVTSDVFGRGIIELCETHRRTGRALAFAFLLYDFTNPQMFKVIEDADYWNALNAISGKYLSVYYIHSRENAFAEDLAIHNGHEYRGLYPVSGDGPLRTVMPLLKDYFALDEGVRLPAILFFQVEGNLISDYFLIELFEERIEESFVELKDYVISAVNQLRDVDPANYANYQPIFECLKQGVKGTKLRKAFFRNVRKFPVSWLVGWLTSKL